MKLALVTTPPAGPPSGIGDYTRRLLTHLAPLADVRVFVEPGREGPPLCGLATESALELFPREHDQVLYQLGNERAHAFMLPLVRAIGGVVCLHDWVLFDLAVAARPELARGGLRGQLAALREGGLEQLGIYRANWRERRRLRVAAHEPVAPETSVTLREAVLVSGWHAHEGQGRWTGDRAVLHLPARGCRRVHLSVSGAPGRSLRVHAGPGRSLQHDFARAADEVLDLDLDGFEPAPLVLETSGLEVTREQRARGDARRLGCFVRSVRYEDEAGWHALDLAAPAAQPIPRVELNRDRFRLPFNRSIVRWADAFVVHSEHVRQKVLIERNAPTPIAVVPHGAERRWRPGPRADGRTALGLPSDWRTACLLVSFGALQAHKRIDVLLEGFALALEERPDLRLALVGRLDAGELDVRSLLKQHGLERAVHLSGYVDEERGHDFLHAADLAVQLRGPSTGGSSGGVHHALSLGRAVIASDLDEQAELPDACVRKLAPGPGEAGRLAELLIALRDDPDERARMEQAAREHVEQVAHFSLVAARYLESFERFPRPRGHKRRMFTQRVRRAVQASSEARSGARPA